MGDIKKYDADCNLAAPQWKNGIFVGEREKCLGSIYRVCKIFLFYMEIAIYKARISRNELNVKIIFAEEKTLPPFRWAVSFN